ncbi:GtrA family protein [Minwuia thermotolerans]|uniref:GtrA family protein n=1 Tax=Minwuia thermotolerans TaxID=2056226 RepID=UPI001F15241A|nr:GtrA family protein [Minwuia thermotolerans]
MGILCNLLGYGLFLILHFAGLNPVLVSGITYIIMVSVSYLVNRTWAFRSRCSHSRDMPRYLLAYFIGLVAAMGSMHVLIFFMHPALAQIIVIGLAAIIIYVSLEILRFGRSVADNDH